MGTPLSSLLSSLWQQYGEYHYRRQDVKMQAAIAQQRVSRLKTTPPLHIAGQAVTQVETSDGVKLSLGARGWIMVRPSGTEPVLRLYCEAESEPLVDALLKGMASTLRV